MCIAVVEVILCWPVNKTQAVSSEASGAQRAPEITAGARRHGDAALSAEPPWRTQAGSRMQGQRKAARLHRKTLHTHRQAHHTDCRPNPEFGATGYLYGVILYSNRKFPRFDFGYERYSLTDRTGGLVQISSRVLRCRGAVLMPVTITSNIMLRT